MKIDYLATKQNIFNTGRTLAGWSRLNGFPRGTVTVILNGGYTTKNPNKGIHGKVIAALEADGFLVRLPDDGQEQERAA